MGKMVVLVILAIIVGTVALIAVSACLHWAWHLWRADRQIVRDEAREAKWLREDLEDAVSRQSRRKSRGKPQ